MADAATAGLPYPHARNDCGICRERDADFEVTVDDPVVARRMSLLCQRCLGQWAVTQVYLLDGRAVMTLAWAPGLSGHGLLTEGEEDG